MLWLHTARNYWQGFISLLFPPLCMACNQVLKGQEQVLCLSCRTDLPYTQFHLQEDNIVAKRFWGRVEIAHATALFHFTKGGKVQQLIHHLKYEDRPDAGIYAGELLGRQLQESHSFGPIDLILPVPLHPKKQRKRGYNQSAAFGQGISKVLKVPLRDDILRRAVFTESQTHKNRDERWQNVKDVFELADADSIENKHILLVDDVVTTGATLEACAIKLLEAKDVRVSIATIAMAD